MVRTLAKKDCGYEALAFAIMERAVDDLRHADKKPDMEEDLEVFFLSDWFVCLCATTTRQDPETIRKLAYNRFGRSEGDKVNVGAPNNLPFPVGCNESGTNLLRYFHSDIFKKF